MSWVSRALVLTGLAILSLFPLAGASILIDNFNDLSGTFAIDGSDPFQGAVAPTGNSLGGFRKLNMFSLSGPGTLNVDTGITLDGALTATYPSETHAGVQIWWDGGNLSGTNQESLASVDLTSGGTANAFIFEFPSNASGGGSFFVEVHSAGQGWVYEVPVANLVSGSLIVPFSAFPGLPNFTQVTSLALTLDNKASSSGLFFQIDNFATTFYVPEPSTGLLAASALVLLGVLRKKKS